jgi:predicted ATP-grasp superfamily ATP-dependent carboligase
MRAFVYEYLSSGAAGDASALPSLQREGWAMLSAVLEDLARRPEIETLTLLDSQRQYAPGSWPAGTIVHFAETGNEEKLFRTLAAAADFCLVIAPEFDGLLEQRSRWVEEEGGRLLGPSTAAIRLTADKLALTCHWQKHRIPTPTVLESLLETPSNSFVYPLVAKPRYGAGSQATFLLHNPEDLAAAVLQARAEGWSNPLLLQAYAPGLAVSVSFLSGSDKRRSLPAVQQRLSDDGRFHYLGGRLPLPPALDHRARHLAERAAGCVEGLHGWFGVDLVLGAAEDGRGDSAIEINPRLTTSYLGLRRLARFNLMEALLAVAAGLSTPPWEWGRDTIAFRVEDG